MPYFILIWYYNWKGQGDGGASLDTVQEFESEMFDFGKDIYIESPWCLSLTERHRESTSLGKKRITPEYSPLLYPLWCSTTHTYFPSAVWNGNCCDWYHCASILSGGVYIALKVLGKGIAGLVISVVKVHRICGASWEAVQGFTNNDLEHCMARPQEQAGAVCTLRITQ